jgi:hypothetical protein
MVNNIYRMTTANLMAFVIFSTEAFVYMDIKFLRRSEWLRSIVEHLMLLMRLHFLRLLMLVVLEILVMCVCMCSCLALRGTSSRHKIIILGLNRPLSSISKGWRWPLWWRPA